MNNYILEFFVYYSIISGFIILLPAFDRYSHKVKMFFCCSFIFSTMLGFLIAITMITAHIL